MHPLTGSMSPKSAGSRKISRWRGFASDLWRARELIEYPLRWHEMPRSRPPRIGGDPIVHWTRRQTWRRNEDTSLDALRDALAKYGTKTFLVMRHDRIVYEWYAADFSAEKTHGTASLAWQA